MAPSLPGMLHATRQVPNVTNICGGCCTSGKWTLNLLCGRCFICSRRHRGSTAIFTTENRPRTSGPETIQLFWFCLASGCVVSVSLFVRIWLNATNQIMMSSWYKDNLTLSVFFCSVNNRLWFGAGHGCPGDSEAAVMGGLRRLHRSGSAHINTYVVSSKFVSFTVGNKSVVSRMIWL